VTQSRRPFGSPATAAQSFIDELPRRRCTAWHRPRRAEVGRIRGYVDRRPPSRRLSAAAPPGVSLVRLPGAVAVSRAVDQ
jgi:hypothetical protein